MDDLKSILDAARKEYKNENYYYAIYPLEEFLNRGCQDDAFQRVKIALYVFFDFLDNDKNKAIIWNKLIEKKKWPVSELNLKIVEEYFKYTGHIEFQEKASQKAEEYCDKNLLTNDETFDLYFYKAKLWIDDVDKWLHFLGKALSLSNEQIENVLWHIDSTSYKSRNESDYKKISEWLQQFPAIRLRVHFLNAVFQEKLGNYDQAIAGFSFFKDTKFFNGAERHLVSLYRKTGKIQKALEIARKREADNGELIKELYLETGNVEKFKELCKEDRPYSRHINTNKLLKYKMYCEALQEIEIAQSIPDAYVLYMKVRALWGEYWLRKPDLNFLEREIFLLTAYGRDLSIRKENSGKDTPMSMTVAQFYMMEARVYFLLNIRFLKNERQNILATKQGKENRGFGGLTYTHRDRIKEIFKEFKVKSFTPPDYVFNPQRSDIDFRLKDFEGAFNRAISLLEKAYEKIRIEMEELNHQTLLKKSELSIDEMWDVYWKHFENECFQSCKNILDRIEKEQPSNPRMFQEKGRVFYRLGQNGDAVKWLEKALGQFEKYHERPTSSHNLMQQVYAAMIANDNSEEERKNDLVDQLNKSFETWFKADISLFKNLAEKPPWYGHRRHDLIQTLQGQTIYKFCTFNMNSISALSDEKIYFSQPKQLNDPFDMDGYLETINKEEFEFVFEEVKNKVSCFCSTLQKDNLQMWAHYADSFTGICIGYEFKKLPKNIAWRSIRYPDIKKGSGALVDTLFVSYSP